MSPTTYAYSGRQTLRLLLILLLMTYETSFQLFSELFCSISPLSFVKMDYIKSNIKSMGQT